MSLFLTLLPIYIFGNLHCAGMCGPLVMLLAKNRFRWWYFMGRFLAFALTGLLAAEMGFTLFSFFDHYHLSALFSFLFGLWIVLIGLLLFFQFSPPGAGWWAQKSSRITEWIAKLALKNRPTPLFLFGMSTVILPCGQSLVVFSTLALNGSPVEGFINGALFALLTSPSLIAALYASQFFLKARRNYPLLIGGSAVLIGLLSVLRGCADLGYLPHYIMNPHAPPHFHIVLF